MRRIFIVLALSAIACLTLIGCWDHAESNRDSEYVESSEDASYTTSSRVYDFLKEDGGQTGTTSENSHAPSSLNEPWSDKKDNAIDTATSSGVNSIFPSFTKRTDSNTPTSFSNSQTNQSSDEESSFTNSSGSTTVSSQCQSSSRNTEYGIVLPDDEWD